LVARGWICWALGAGTTVPGTKKLQLISRCETQRAVILYKDWRPLPSSRDFGDVGVLCTFNSIPSAAAEAAGIAKSLQLSSSLSRQGIQYDMAGGTARPTQYKSSPLHSSPSASAGQDAVLGRFSTAFGLCGETCGF
jgi:hypothetical protein